jgi:hypothetical protein
VSYAPQGLYGPLVVRVQVSGGGTMRTSDFNLVHSMKAGRVVILLAGRHAGKKAIIVKQHDDGKKVGLVAC